MEGRNRNIKASNAGAREEIIKCAMYSYCGRIIYRKWSKKERRFILRSHVVVPIDCGVTSRGNEVLFAEDVKENMQVKQFIIRQILDFENLKEKRKTTFPIKLDNIRRMLGIRNVNEEEYGMAAGRKGIRNLVAGELVRIAQEIYEFSGCEGHLYSGNKMKNPDSYDAIGGMDRVSAIARKVVAYLSPSQKELTEHFTKQRREGLSFGNYFQWNSDGRCFIPLKSKGIVQDLSLLDDKNAQEIFDILHDEGYFCPDYSSGYCYKESDKEMTAKNPPKVLTILKKALRGDKGRYDRLAKAFNERKSGTMKRKGNIQLVMCITHNPEDVAGMSTDRDWTSCMRLPSSPVDVSKSELEHACSNRLDREIYMLYYGILGRQKLDVDGIAKKTGSSPDEVKRVVNSIDSALMNGGLHYSTALKQVKYGGMCAYLLREDDLDISHPLARIAIKRLENKEGGFVFEAESRIYGDSFVASSCRFMETLKDVLKKSNETTMKGDSEYVRNDGNSWSDAGISIRQEDATSLKHLCNAPWHEVYDALKGGKVDLSEEDVAKIIDSHYINPPLGIFDVFATCMKSGFSEEFLDKYEKFMDVDRYNFEHGIPLTPMEFYKGDDAPVNEAQMTELLKVGLENTKYSGEYGSVSEYDDDAVFEGQVNPVDVALEHSGDVPEPVSEYAKAVMASTLKDYYDDHKKELGFSSFALFEEAFESYDMDEEALSNIYDYLYEMLSWEAMVFYKIETSVIDVYDGERRDNAVYHLAGNFRYVYGPDGDTIAYSNETIIDTEDAKWKKKLNAFCEDLHDQIPNFFG